jgi:segregation and condensation protein A
MENSTEQIAAVGGPLADPQSAKPHSIHAVDRKLSAISNRQNERLAQKKEESDSPFAVSVTDVYEGPLDLLLDLIRKQDIDIYDIPIARITAQYLEYVEKIRELDVNVAADFIYMAAVLIHIKSKMLLPRDPLAKPEELEDPRTELVNRLLEHEKFKSAAQMLLQKQQTFQQILERLRTRPVINVDEETVTVGQMIGYLRKRLEIESRPIRLKRLLLSVPSRQALVCMFLALLEMVRLQAIQVRQDQLFGEIAVRKHTAFDAVMAEQSAVRDDWK